MAVDFPTSPSDGDTVTVGTKTYSYSASKGVWKDVAGDDLTPSTLSQYMQVANTTALTDQYLQVANSSSIGVTSYNDITDLPMSNQTTGKLAFVSGNNRLYIWNGTGWYNIALINTSPTISGASSSYTLSKTGANTVVTLVASDPEGLPISFTASHTGLGVGANAIATVTQSNNIFTFTPTTNTSLGGTFTTTFTASDGVNIAGANSSFTLLFNVENSNYTTALVTSVGSNNADNNDFVDSSTSAHSLTTNGTVTQGTFSPYRHGGYSTYFDGTGDYLDLTTNAVLTIGTSDFTAECWIFVESGASLTSYWRSCFSLQGDGNSNAGSISIYMDDGGDGYPAGSPAVISNNNSFRLQSNSDVRGQWTHVAIARESGTLRFFVNGSLADSTSDSTNYNGTNPTRVGVSAVSQSNYWLGYVADARLVIGTALYTSAFTPPTERLTAITNTSLLTCHLPYIAGDVAPVGYTGSGSIIGSSGSLDSGTLANAFDGSLSTSVAIRNSGSFIEFTFPQQQTGELQVNITNGNDVGDNNVQFWIDGVAGTSFDVSSQTWYSLTSSSDSFTTVKLEHSGSTTANIYGFRIGTSGDTITGLRPDITINGNTKTEPFAPYDYGEVYAASTNGGSMFFDGSAGYSNYLSKGSSSDFQFGTGDFTVESWVYITGNGALPPSGGPVGNIVSYSTTGSGGDGGWLFYVGATTNTGDNGLAFQYWYSSGNADTLSSTNNLGQNVWNHVAAVRSGNTLKLYTNGVEVASKTFTYNMTLGTTLGVGMRPWTPNNYKFPLDGLLTDTRVVNGTAVYTANFTPPTSPLSAVTNTKLLLKGTNAGIIDKSQSVQSLTLNGDVKSSTTQTKYLTSSMYFDGSGDRIQLPQPSLNLGSNNFTVEAWVYTTATSQQAIAGSLVYSNGTGSWLLAVNYNSNKIRFFMRHGGGTVQDAQFEAGTFPTNQWVHVAVTRDGANLRAFINGTQAGTTNTALGSNAIDNALTNYYIGDNQDGNMYWNGYISDFRVTIGLARYTSSFTPPTAALQG